MSKCASTTQAPDDPRSHTICKIITATGIAWFVGLAFREHLPICLSKLLYSPWDSLPQSLPNKHKQLPKPTCAERVRLQDQADMEDIRFYLQRQERSNPLCDTDVHQVH
jgi:hypothetical protein